VRSEILVQQAVQRAARAGAGGTQAMRPQPSPLKSSRESQRDRLFSGRTNTGAGEQSARPHFKSKLMEHEARVIGTYDKEDVSQAAAASVMRVLICRLCSSTNGWRQTAA
jgi:hypothetical protein